MDPVSRAAPSRHDNNTCMKQQQQLLVSAVPHLFGGLYLIESEAHGLLDGESFQGQRPQLALPLAVVLLTQLRELVHAFLGASSFDLGTRHAGILDPLPLPIPVTTPLPIPLPAAIFLPIPAAIPFPLTARTSAAAAFPPVSC